jgi:FKBP-type peptidyl-prolyl cis-trans isomerase
MRKSGDFLRAMPMWVAGLAAAGLAGAGPDTGGVGRAAPPALEANTSVEPSEPAVSPDVSSYDIGLVLGRELYQNGLGDAARQDALIRGLREGLAGTVASNEQRKQANQFIKAGRDAITERHQREAREFLEKNAKADGVRTTASGLQYRVLTAGDPAGHPPGANDEVTVHYRAALSDGVEFDSSYAHGRPATLQMTSIIRGWREALLMMRPGARWQLFVPPDLAYGTNPPPAVPPGSLLIYELELLRIEPPNRRAESLRSPSVMPKTGEAAGAHPAAPPK